MNITERQNNFDFAFTVARRNEPTTEDSAVISSAVSVINADSKLSPEDKTRLSELLTLHSPHPRLTADTLLSTAETDGLLSAFLLKIRKGVDFVRTGGGGRPQSETSVAIPSEVTSHGSTPSRVSRISRSSAFTRVKYRSPVRRCEVTARIHPTLESCHIFPFSIGKGNPLQEHLWDTLYYFWPREIIDKAKEQLTATPGNINFLTNALMLCSDAHRAFDALDFYLEPDMSTISPGVDSYTAVFHWTREHPDNLMFSCWEVIGYGPREEPLYRGMYSGDRVVFSTTDANKYPLPDPTLLILRALLAKISHNNASIHSPQLEYDDTDSDGGSYLGDDLSSAESTYETHRSDTPKDYIDPLPGNTQLSDKTKAGIIEVWRDNVCTDGL